MQRQSSPLLVMNHNTLKNNLKKWQTLTFQKKNIILESDIFNFSLKSKILFTHCFLLSRASLKPVCVQCVQSVKVCLKQRNWAKQSFLHIWQILMEAEMVTDKFPYASPIWHFLRKQYLQSAVNSGIIFTLVTPTIST